MLKNLMLALVPLTLLASSAKADDELTIDVASITDADVSIVETDLDIDVDQLSADAGVAEQNDDAIEACFRRFGYRYRGWGGCYRGCYNYCYNYCYNHCRPLYSYRTICYAPPVYRCVVTPIYHYYWGCY